MAPSSSPSSPPRPLAEAADVVLVWLVFPLVVLGVLGGAVYGVYVWADATYGWSAPDTFTGDVPHAEHPLLTNPDSLHGVGGPFIENQRENDLRWRVSTGRPVSTTLETLDGEPRPYTVHRMAGYLSIENADDCPGARVAWTLSPLQGSPLAPPPLSADEPDSDSVSEYALPEVGTTDVRVDLRRLDAAPCEAVVAWHEASLK